MAIWKSAIGIGVGGALGLILFRSGKGWRMAQCEYCDRIWCCHGIQFCSFECECGKQDHGYNDNDCKKKLGGTLKDF